VIILSFQSLKLFEEFKGNAVYMDSETWFLILRKEHTLQVTENKVMGVFIGQNRRLEKIT
jgi:hypothetical protein